MDFVFRHEREKHRRLRPGQRRPKGCHRWCWMNTVSRLAISSLLVLLVTMDPKVVVPSS